jgi:hypothetical protein
LSPSELQQKFQLNYPPTHFSEVDIDTGVNIRMGHINRGNSLSGGNYRGRPGSQYEIMDPVAGNTKLHWKPMKPL